MQTTVQHALADQRKSQPLPGKPPSAPAPKVESASRPPAGRRIVPRLVAVLILIALAGLGGYFLGGLGLSAQKDQTPKDKNPPPMLGVSLVKDKLHTLEVPEDVRTTLGSRKGNRDLIAVAQVPATMRPLQLIGSTLLDPTRLARIRTRFPSARVVEIGQVHDFSPKTGQSIFRELQTGDHVRKGEVLGVFYSVDVGCKKNDLLDALVQLELDQQILDNAEKHRQSVPEVFMLTQIRAVQGDHNAINRAMNNLEAWDIPQDEIDALREEARKICADKKAWSKTREGRWVKGEKPGKTDSNRENENPWGRVTLRAPFDGVIVERNLHVDEMVVDNTVNLFQIADVNRLLVIADAPEDDLPTLEALERKDRRWTVRTIGSNAPTVLSGTIDEIGYLIDPNQHTAVIKGYVENPGERLRAGQTITATICIPPPSGVVEIPNDALVDDGKQSLVFVQTDAAKHQYTMRRVQVTQSLRTKGVCTQHADPQGRAIDRPGGGGRLAAQRAPSTGPAPPPLGSGRTQSGTAQS